MKNLYNLKTEQAVLSLLLLSGGRPKPNSPETASVFPAASLSASPHQTKCQTGTVPVFLGRRFINAKAITALPAN